MNGRTRRIEANRALFALLSAGLLWGASASNLDACTAGELSAGLCSSPQAAAEANSLGVWHEKGKHGLRRNVQTAIYWYTLAANHGNALAMHNLGDLYRDGKGVPRNGGMAFQWYSKAAATGHAIGLEDMGDCYFNGVGVAPNWEQALQLYRQAAARGRQSAARKLRRMGQ